MSDVKRCEAIKTSFSVASAMINGDDVQCSRKAVKDGFCNQHHPATISAREAKAIAKFDKEREELPINKIILLERKNKEQAATIKQLEARCKEFEDFIIEV